MVSSRSSQWSGSALLADPELFEAPLTVVCQRGRRLGEGDRCFVKSDTGTGPGSTFVSGPAVSCFE